MTTHVEQAESKKKGHKWFAALFDPVFSKRSEETYMKEIRPRIIDGARGRVLEIGAGTGHSLPYYRGKSFAELAITEPDPYMLERLLNKFDDAGIKAKLAEAPAEKLPFPDHYFDTVLSVHVLCSVRDVPKALAEVRRVLKPDGQFRFFDHVRAYHPLGAFAQDLVQPIWSQIGGGCHPNRDVASVVEKAGFRLVEHERMHPFPAVQPMLFEAFARPHVFGVAVPSN